jgi:hypothetical protein
VRWINDPETCHQVMLGWAFNYLNLNRISLSVYAYNVSSQKVGGDGVFAGGVQPLVAYRPQTPRPKLTEMIPYNERDVRCYQKCGFQHEGTMRQARYADG